VTPGHALSGKERYDQALKRLGSIAVRGRKRSNIAMAELCLVGEAVGLPKAYQLNPDVHSVVYGVPPLRHHLRPRGAADLLSLV